MQEPEGPLLCRSSRRENEIVSKAGCLPFSVFGTKDPGYLMCNREEGGNVGVVGTEAMLSG